MRSLPEEEDDDDEDDRQCTEAETCCFCWELRTGVMLSALNLSTQSILQMSSFRHYFHLMSNGMYFGLGGSEMILGVYHLLLGTVGLAMSGVGWWAALR